MLMISTSLKGIHACSLCILYFLSAIVQPAPSGKSDVYMYLYVHVPTLTMMCSLISIIWTYQVYGKAYSLYGPKQFLHLITVFFCTCTCIPAPFYLLLLWSIMFFVRVCSALQMVQWMYFLPLKSVSTNSEKCSYQCCLIIELLFTVLVLK